MNFFSHVLSTPLAERIGWTLLHSLWQFALLAVLLAGVLEVLRRQSANLRYLVGCFALAAMLTAGWGRLAPAENSPEKAQKTAISPEKSSAKEAKTLPDRAVAGSPQGIAIYRVLGHEKALPFGEKQQEKRRRVIFSDDRDGGDGPNRFDAMRPENYPLDGLILDKKPLLMEGDIESYELPKHVLRLKPGAVERLAAEIDAPVWGTPFVVVADGQRVFLGAFWTHLSSYLADMPTISLARLQSRLPQDDPNYLPKNAIRLDRARFPRHEGNKTWISPQQDERTDARLLNALQKRQKLLDRRSLQESQWGKSVKGVQCRLRPEKSVWKVGETPQIVADLRNRGQRNLSFYLNHPEWEIQYDGVWYRATTATGVPVLVSHLKPGDRKDGISLLLDASYDWRSKGDNRRLEFKPGKHTLRAVFRPRAENAGELRVESNAVEIEIVEKDAGTAPKQETPRHR